LNKTKGCLIANFATVPITEQGRVALTDAKAKVKELFGELIEGK